ncbi:hypothetical protein [Polaribacter gangjinensis]|uniref:Lipocalin-like domain-containing protein n=1 Tax=Polaribacter gangjinensis TaxID=574710 RepID=A0A2S7WF20_9FLAO|nr:hypothetical protein [Polaribacter gangjinensis]PQJ75842.1 hypothetical protein BTO13_11695 [Polaribacter gangjinensis]
MKNFFKKFRLFLLLVTVISFTNCEDSNEVVSSELTIQQKVALLEESQWLLKGFEDRVMHTFKDSKQFTYYGTNNVFEENPIPGALNFTIEGNLITIDYNFGNINSYELTFSCNNSIVEFSQNGAVVKTLYKRGSNFQQCL